MPFSPELIKNILSKCPICGLEEPCPLHSQKTADFREKSIDQEEDYELPTSIKEHLPQMQEGLLKWIESNIPNNWAEAGHWSARLLTLDPAQGQLMLKTIQDKNPGKNIKQKMRVGMLKTIESYIPNNWESAGYWTARLLTLDPAQGEFSLKALQDKRLSDKRLSRDIRQEMQAGLLKVIENYISNDYWAYAGAWTARLLTLDPAQGELSLKALQDKHTNIDIRQNMQEGLLKEIESNISNNWASAGYWTADLVILLKHFKQIHKAEDNNKIIKSDIPPLPITKKY